MNNNLRFNRVGTRRGHMYLKEFGAARTRGEHDHTGYVKCKLVHHESYSTIVPDQIYLDAGDKILWIQPLFFLPSILGFDDTDGVCRIDVDISHGVRVTIEFLNNAVKAMLKKSPLLLQLG